jgi:hypothetical protein
MSLIHIQIAESIQKVPPQLASITLWTLRGGVADEAEALLVVLPWYCHFQDPKEKMGKVQIYETLIGLTMNTIQKHKNTKAHKCLHLMSVTFMEVLAWDEIGLLRTK